MGTPQAGARSMKKPDEKDAFDRWWEWAGKPGDSPLMIPAQIHEAVMMLTEEERRDRAIVNEAVRTEIARE